MVLTWNRPADARFVPRSEASFQKAWLGIGGHFFFKLENPGTFSRFWGTFSPENVIPAYISVRRAVIFYFTFSIFPR